MTLIIVIYQQQRKKILIIHSLALLTHIYNSSLSFVTPLPIHLWIETDSKEQEEVHFLITEMTGREERKENRIGLPINIDFSNCKMIRQRSVSVPRQTDKPEWWVLLNISVCYRASVA